MTFVTLLCIFASFEFGASGVQAAEIPDVLVAESAGKVVLTPPKAHHFNLKSPNRLEFDGKESPGELAASRISARIPPGAREFRASVFLCDDAQTYCAKKTIRRKISSR